MSPYYPNDIARLVPNGSSTRPLGEPKRPFAATLRSPKCERFILPVRLRKHTLVKGFCVHPAMCRSTGGIR
jgi:hypothetical protein